MDISADSSATRSTHVINQRSDGCSEGNSSRGEGEEERGGGDSTLNRMDIHFGGRMERSERSTRGREEGVGGIKSNHAHIYVAYSPMVAPTAKMRLHASLAGARASEQELTKRVQRGHRHERKRGKRGVSKRSV